MKWKLSAAKLIYSLEGLFKQRGKKNNHGAPVQANRNKENVSTIKYYFVYVFRGNWINSGKEAVMTEKYQPGSKTKSSVYSGQGEVSNKVLSTIWQERKHEIPKLVGSSSDMILADWRRANVFLKGRPMQLQTH